MEEFSQNKDDLLADLQALRKRTEELEASAQKGAEAEKELRLWRRSLDEAGVIIVVIDKGQNVRLINRKGCEILGYEAQEIVGRNWFDTFIPEKIREDVKGIFDELMLGKLGLAEYFDNTVLTKLGKEKIVSWHNALLRDDDGKIVGTISIGEDITERRKAENEKERIIEMLTDSLNEMKSLKVMIPICSLNKENLSLAIRKHYENVLKEGKCLDCMNALRR